MYIYLPLLILEISINNKLHYFFSLKKKIKNKSQCSLYYYSLLLISL